MSFPRGILTFLIILVITPVLANGSAKLGSNHLLKLHASKFDLSMIKHKWIKQPLDHFDPSEKRTFKWQYLERLDLWQPNGPIYIFIALDSWKNKKWIINDEMSFICQMAKDTNGSVLLTEHRYYGKSVPNIPSDNITEYYKFLSSPQALADVANLIRSVKSDPKFKSSKVVVVGYWYGGNLATWLRQLYPDLVDAAIAASAPLLAQKDFKEFYEGVAYKYGKYGGEKCLNNIETYFKRCGKLLQTSDGIETLKKELKICPSSDLTVLENQQWLYSYILYGYLGQLSYIENSSIIQDYCKKHYEPRDMFTLDLAKRTGSVPLSEGCLVVDFNPDDFTYDPWVYQYCTEFGYLKTTTSERQPFVHWNPLEFRLKFCKGFYKGAVEKRIDEGVARTNKMYGGKHPNVTKVVFTHGDMDPWHTLGVLQDLGPDAPAIIVNGTSQGAVLATRKEEPEELTKVRKHVKELIKKWISTT